MAFHTETEAHKLFITEEKCYKSHYSSIVKKNNGRKIPFVIQKG